MAIGGDGVSYKRTSAETELNKIDSIPAGKEEAGFAVASYVKGLESDRQSQYWARTMPSIENILFSSGKQYLDGLLATRIMATTPDLNQSDIKLVKDTIRNIPRPINDFLGRYVESNIALLTENRPKPRVTPKSDSDDDKTAASISELLIEYLWEAINMPEKHREIARIILHCGTCFMEVFFDKTMPRRFSVPATSPAEPAELLGPGQGVDFRQPLLDELGNPVFQQNPSEYGDLVANIVSPFELHLPMVHWWEDINWVIKESYMQIDSFKQMYSSDRKLKGLTKANGWYLKKLDEIKGECIHNLPLWWWERLSHLVEGSAHTLNLGSPEQWNDHVVIKTFDRKPTEKWPRGRTIVVAGDVLIYDSPKEIGARAYDPRWPNRWHPYLRYRWEPMVGNLYARSLIGKLLPKLKRINAIDTTLIQWRRTTPTAGWIMPKGTHVVEDQWQGGSGRIFEFDARRTSNMKPEPIYPPPFPNAMLEERNMMISEMEAIAGTEEVLRGQRPVGVNSALMMDVLRKQALASRSAILQEWDETLQGLGSILLQEVIKNAKKDTRYLEGIHILARQKNSRLTIKDFSNINLVDNIQIRVDTASQALISKEAREAKALEFLQYAPALMQLPLTLRQALVEEIGFGQAMTPQGPDVGRANKLISFVRNRQFSRVIPLPYDDPYIFAELLINELKADSTWDFDQDQFKVLNTLIGVYTKEIQRREQQAMQLEMLQAQLRGGPRGRPPGSGGAQQPPQ